MRALAMYVAAGLMAGLLLVAALCVVGSASFK
jgi:hypothetical protein